MTILYSCSDRVPVQMGDMTFYFSPYSQRQKMEYMGMIKACGEDPQKLMDVVTKMVRTSLKSAQGIERPNGDRWQVDIGEDNLITENCMGELMNIEVINEIFTIAGILVNGIPRDGQVIHPQTGRPLEGVHVKKSLSKVQ